MFVPGAAEAGRDPSARPCDNPGMPFDASFIQGRVRRSAEVIGALASQAGAIESIARAAAGCLARGGTVLTCGNGGSAAEALHLAEELIGRYKRDRAPKRAVCLNADPTALTCIANDFGFDQVYARQVEALAGKGDVVVAFSTSGSSTNIVNALRAARTRGATAVALLGKGGGAARAHADLALVVDAPETEHIQEAHQVVLHLILEAVEMEG